MTEELKTSRRLPFRFSLRALLVGVALAGILLAVFLWLPWKTGVWESMAPAILNQQRPPAAGQPPQGHFAIDFKRKGVEIVAVPTRVGREGVYADRFLFWFDGQSVRHANLIADGQLNPQPIRLDGDWPLKIGVSTRGELTILETFTLDEQGRVGGIRSEAIYGANYRLLADDVEQWGHDYLLNKPLRASSQK